MRGRKLAGITDAKRCRDPELIFEGGSFDKVLLFVCDKNDTSMTFHCITIRPTERKAGLRTDTSIPGSM